MRPFADRGHERTSPRCSIRHSFVEVASPSETTTAEAAWLSEHLLSATERAEANRFHRADDQHDRIVAKALVRLGLASYFPVAPRDWAFRRDANGRLHIVSPDRLPPIQFSLSHTQGLVALLVTRASQAALDVEKIKATDDLVNVSEQILAPQEMESLKRLSGNAWTFRFFELWTLKEAYAKARGVGLAMPLRDMAFEIDTLRRVRAIFPELEDEQSRWQFSLRQVTPTHILATAIHSDHNSPPEISFRTVRVGVSQGAASLERR